MNDEYWESARKEADHEQIMEGIGNMVYEEALTLYCEEADKEDCICGNHVDFATKPFRGVLTKEETFMIGEFFKLKYEAYIKENSCGGCGNLITHQPLTQASTGKKYHNSCYPNEEEY